MASRGRGQGLRSQLSESPHVGNNTSIALSEEDLDSAANWAHGRQNALQQLNNVSGMGGPPFLAGYDNHTQESQSGTAAASSLVILFSFCPSKMNIAVA